MEEKERRVSIKTRQGIETKESVWKGQEGKGSEGAGEREESKGIEGKGRERRECDFILAVSES